MRLVRSFPLMAFALVLLSIVGYCIAEPSLGLLVVAGALAAMSWFITEGPRGRSLPRWVSNLLTAAVAINVVVDFAQNFAEPIGVLGRFAVWLSLIKLYERKSPRDYAQLLALSLLLMLVGCLQSPDMVFGLTLLAYTILGLYVLLLYQLYCSFDRAKAERSEQMPAGYRLTPSVQPIAGRNAALQARVLVGAIAVVGLALSAIVFIVAPRHGGAGGGWSPRLTSSRQAVTGFSDQVNLISGSRITDSRRIVATLQLRDRSGKVLNPAAPPLLRGAVLTRYDGNGLWTAPAPQRQPRTISSQPGVASMLASDLRIAPDANVVEQHFSVAPRGRAHDARVVLALATAVQIETDQPANFLYDQSTQTIELVSSGWLSVYTVRTEPMPDDETLRTLAGGDRPDPIVSGGYSRAEVRNLARDLLRAAQLPTEPPSDWPQRWEWNRTAAITFKAHLQSGRYVYQTDLSGESAGNRSGEDRDPIARFLLENRRGHCEYFASALTAMCQSVGIPARLVTGFAAIEFDPDADAYVIREAHAHAWTEVLIDDYRWLAIDPTPSGALSGGSVAGRSFGDWLRSLYDAIEFRWSLHVVNFDSGMQSQIVSSVTAAWMPRWDEITAAVLAWMRQVNVVFDLGPAGYVWLGIVAFALLLAVIVAVKVTRRVMRLRAVLRLRSLRGARRARLLRQLGFYLDMLGVLERGGAGKPAWQPPAHYAAQLQRRDPALAGLVSELTDLFYLSRFGGRDLDRDQLGRATRLLRDLATRLRVSI